MARPVKHDGIVYKRRGSNIWWMQYRDRDGQRRRESTETDDWDGAQRKLRERLQARDDRTLEVVRKGEQITFHDWAAIFLENYSMPPSEPDAPSNSGPGMIGRMMQAGPAMFTAIEEQLGLKLESTKGPIEVLVIDHVEQPSTN